MGIRYTKKEEEQKHDERTVPSEEFVNLMVSSKRMTDEQKELPHIETNK